MVLSYSVLLEKIENIKNIDKRIYYRLRDWYKEIKDYNRLNFNSAKKLNRLMLECGGIEKERYREELISGTLYIVCNFVCESGLTSIKTAVFDIDDIINSSIESWINMLDEGVLIYKNYNCFSWLTKELYSRVIENLFAYGKKEILDTGEETVGDGLISILGKLKYDLGISLINKDTMIRILEKNIELVQIGYDTNEKIFYDCTSLILEDSGVLRNFSKRSREKVILQVYEVSMFIIKNINIMDINRLSKSELKQLFNFFLFVYKYNNKFEILSCDFTDDCEQRMLLDDFNSIVFSSDILSEEQKQAIFGYFGFESNNRKTYRQLAKEMDIPFQIIDYLCKSSYLRLKKNPKIREISKNI